MQSKKKKSILLVDDEESILRSIGWALKRNNYAVTTSSNGRDAIALLLENKYDLIITDLIMTEVGGIEVLQEAKKHQCDTGVVILTGHADLNSAVKALHHGADDYLQKPCDIEDLLNKVNRSLEKQDLVATLSTQNELLKQEIAARKLIEKELEEARVDLEVQVEKRTAELTDTVEKLRLVLATLQLRETELESKNKELHDINTALNIMLKRREQEHQDIRREIAEESLSMVRPLLKKAYNSARGPAKEYIEIAEANLKDVFAKSPGDVVRNANLAPRELQIVHYIRLNKTSKEIADLLDLSVRTVESYRENIRDKLGLKNQRQNLKKYLMSTL